MVINNLYRSEGTQTGNPAMSPHVKLMLDSFKKDDRERIKKVCVSLY